MPKDPNALMQLAARVNGLGSPDMKPWHLKANYQTFDADGKPKEQGVFEEWWASPDKYKISYSSLSFNQVRYHNGDKTWTTGDKGWVPFRDRMVEEYLVHPLRIAPDLQTLHYTVANRKLGQVSLVCASPEPSTNSRPNVAETACFDNQKPVLRLEQPDRNIFVLFNDTIRWDGHYIDKEILIEDATLPIVKANVTAVEFPSTIDNSVLAMPAATNSDERLNLRAGVMAGRKLGGRIIHYPITARQERVQGTVMIAAVITKSGDIANLDVISGPKELRNSALDAIKTWKYQPYLLNGQPVEVSTEIYVDYTLGG
jgi:TonB family protein